MEQNNTGKYLKYAIGEIVLVVIGILIALQINNWNEAKKTKTFELKMLAQIHQALKADYDYTYNHSLGYRNNETIKAVQYFFDLMRGVERPSDSLRHYFNWLSYGLSFQVNLGPYESLKSMGLEKISNDSLRNQIVYFYDFVVPRSRDLINWGQDGANEDGKLKNSLMGSFQYEVVDNKVSVFRPTPDKSIIENPKFLELLKSAEFRSNWTKNQFNEYLGFMKPLKENIENELKK